MYTSLEICAGAGGQALGLEMAGFEHVALVEIDKNACETLRTNRPEWRILEQDLKSFSAFEFRGIDLLAGGVPCPPFSIAGKQLGEMDERDLFPETLRLIRETAPRAVMIENVKGILGTKFWAYRKQILSELSRMGYACDWKVLNASDYGVPQLRPRAVLIALQKDVFPFFRWPQKQFDETLTVGKVLLEEMSSNGWENAKVWSESASTIAPTLVGGSKKHGGADLGPTRARAKWLELGVDGRGLADAPPTVDSGTLPRLTVSMAALVQGFPKEWTITGKKTNAYRQVGNAFPPPVAMHVGSAILLALKSYDQSQKGRQSQTA